MDLKPVVAILFLLSSSCALMDYCYSNNFSTNTTWMQFAKEVVNTEYGVENKFKSLHCCAKGYRTIEWFKDGKPYPWSLGQSNFIVYPEAVNQTLYTQRIIRSDKGNYTCLLRNETHQMQHTILLDVIETTPNYPKATFIPSDQWVELGAKVRLYCEAFVGHINLADAHSDIKWRRMRPSQSPTEDDQIEINLNHKELKIKREQEDVVGSLLLIESVRPEDYGKYICTVRNNDAVTEIPVTLHFKANKVQPETWTRTQLAIAISLTLATLAALYALWWRCGGAAALRLRSLAASRTPLPADTRPDTLIACTLLDEPLVRSALAPTLERKYHYKLQRLTLPDDPQSWYSILIEKVPEVRSLVVVLSPRQYTVGQLHEAVKQIRALPLPPVIVLLQDLPKLKQLQKDATGETLISLLRKTRVIAWKHLRDRQFWTNLRLALPLPNPQIVPNQQNTVDLKEMPAPRNESRSGSIDALV